MHVLMNALQAANRSGTGRHTIELARALAKRSDALELSLLWPAGAAEGPPEGVRVFSRDARNIPRLLDDQYRILSLQRECGAELLHYPANVGLMRGDAKFVLTVHDLAFIRNPEWFTPTRSNYYRRATLRSAPRAERIITVSRAARDDLIELAGVDPDRIDVIHNGVEPEFHPRSAEEVQQVRDSLRLPERFVLFVGTLEPRKNVIRLVRAWEQIAEEADVDLVIVGRSGWKTEPILQTIERSRLFRRIHLVGHVPGSQLPAVYTAAKALVWPSLFEGFGLPPLEAMACGTPALTSNTSSLPEVAGDAAVLVNPHDTDTIAAGMLNIVQNEEFRKELRARGIVRAKQFTWDRAADLTIQTYRRALGL